MWRWSGFGVSLRVMFGTTYSARTPIKTLPEPLLPGQHSARAEGSTRRRKCHSLFNISDVHRVSVTVAVHCVVSLFQS